MGKQRDEAGTEIPGFSPCRVAAVHQLGPPEVELSQRW